MNATQHFGILKDRGYKEMPAAQQEALLLELRTHQVKYRCNIPRNGLPVAIVADPKNRIVVPTKVIEQELYNYIMEELLPEIEYTYYEFFHAFNEETYGLDLTEKRRLGLFYFKLLAEKAKNHSISIMTEIPADNHPNKIVPESVGKLELLMDQKNALMSRTAQSALLIEYLLGTLSGISIENVAEDLLLSEILDLEGNLKILQSLNDLYSFETIPCLNQPSVNANNNAVVVPELGSKSIQDFPQKASIKVKKAKRGRLSDEEARKFLLESVFKVRSDYK